MVKTKLTDADGRSACTLQYRPDALRIHSAVRIPFPADTVAYAVARYIRHCPELRTQLVRRAVRYGLNTGKCPRKTVKVSTTAAALSMPGSAAQITLSVSTGTVEIRAIRII